MCYIVTNGRDIQVSIRCDRDWKAATLELLEFIDNQSFDDARLEEVLKSLSMEDSHWEWSKKAIYFNSDEYEWFHLYVAGKPQGACLMYHPKESALNEGNKFYVEFIAVAPWNRKNLLRDREFKGVGRALLTAVLKYATGELKLNPGFCLHSLPGACDFYLGLDMVRVQGFEKDLLAYFELPESSARKLMEAA